MAYKLHLGWKVSLKKLFLATALLASPPAWANNGDGRIFIEAGVGAANSKPNLKFYNPVGANFTLSEISADKNYIALTARDDPSTSFNAYTTVSYKISPAFSIHASYRYLGTFDASGAAIFPENSAHPFNVENDAASNGPPIEPTGMRVTTADLASTQTQSYRQKLSAKAHAIYLGTAIGANLSPRLFAEASGDLGIALVNSSGSQGADIGGPGVFPNAAHTNLSWAIGAGIGYHISDRISVIIRGTYIDAGTADTGTTTASAASLGMNANERLETKFRTVAVTMGARFEL